MKKLLIISASILLILGCGKKENPFEPNTDAPIGTAMANFGKVASVVPGNNQQLPGNEIKIFFEDYMDASTINNTNITVYDALARANVTITVTYNADAKLAIIAGSFTNDTKFLITVKADVKTVSGNPLDGNDNDKSEGTPYDDYLSLCWKGTGSAVFVRTTPPRFDSTSSSPFRVGNVPTNVTIQLRFTNGPMDTLTLKDLGSYELKKAGNPVGLSVVSVSGTGVDLQPTTTLDANTLYDFTIKGGKIKAQKDTTGQDNYLLILDGDYDGPEQTEPDRAWQFFTAGAETPPRINTVTAITPPGALFTFNARMKLSTLTAENIKVYDGAGYVPGSFVFSPDTTQIYYYYQRTISGTKQYFISKTVEGNNGLKFDGNANGIGGEPWDDRWATF